MTLPPTPPPDATTGGLCSELSARRGLPLIGSAGCYDAVLAFELESPWTPRLVGSRACDAALDAAIERIGKHAKRVRLLALEPEDIRAPKARVLWFQKTGTGPNLRETGTGPNSPANAHDTFPAAGKFGPVPFAQLERRELVVARAELAAVLETIAFDAATDVGVADEAAQHRDLLVCTHGARDACCGKFGYPLYRELCRLVSERTGRDVRVWRSSHLGGHRFAPTLLDLPSGRMFGRLTAADASAVLGGGEALLARVSAIYRGRCVLPDAAQIVERQLWLEVGARFERAALSWNVESSESCWSVDLRASCEGGEGNAGEQTFRASAKVIRAELDAVITPASCGRDPEEEAPWKLLA